MTELAKATLQVMKGQPGKLEPDGAKITVQFNPAALRYQLANTVSVDKASGKLPASQYLGSSSGTLAFDLVFDTTYPADAAATDTTPEIEKYDVRRFLIPIQALVASGKAAAAGADKGGGPKKSTVPLVRFSYGTFTMVGLITALNIEFELFSEAGVPLRAKAAVTMKEIDPAFLANEHGPGGNSGDAAKDPANLNGRPAVGAPAAARPTGAADAGSPDDRTAVARAGESAADLLSRLGRDAASWKELALHGLSPLNLAAGARIDLPAVLSPDVTLGVGATAAASIRSSDSGSAAVLAAGDSRELTAAGGLQAVVATAGVVAAATAAATTRSGFDAPAATPPTAASAPGSTGLRGNEVPAPGRIDLRAQTFGLGVPLRDTVVPTVAATDGRRAGAGSVAPAWSVLPRSGIRWGGRSGSTRCGCGGGCAGGCTDHGGPAFAGCIGGCS